MLFTLISAIAPLLANADNIGPVLRAQRENALPLSEFYQTPQPMPKAGPGNLVRSEATDIYHLPGGVTAKRIAYMSLSAEHRPVMTTAVILIPFGQPPAHGWPVIAWAHGTSGFARLCAPSLMKDIYYGWQGLFEYPMMGYAVVATDYAGLGTEGRHQYMSLAAQAMDVIFSVPAARAAVPTLGERWVAVGHSQGGSAVLEVSELEYERRDPGFLGVVSLAPPTDLATMWHRPGGRGATGYIDVIALGIQAVDPDFNVKDILVGPALAQLPRVEHEACLDAAQELIEAQPAGPLLQPNWADVPAVARFAATNRPDQVRGFGPILLLQGTADRVIPEPLTRQAAVNLCKLGDRVQYQTYEGIDHDPVVYASLRDQLAWIGERFDGRAAPTNCAGR